jgi:predicted DNA binding protein
MPRRVLPADLPNAIKHLSDHELERLVAAVLAEQKHRGRKQEAVSNKRQGELVGVTLTPSKMNAVRAAFKAGIKPSQIARQFGISRTDVQKALASDRE